MLYPFRFLNEPLQNSRPVACEGDVNTTELTNNSYTIFADERLISNILESIKQQKAIMKHNWIDPKFVILNRESYEQIVVYCFNKYHGSFPDKIMDLEIVFNPKYENMNPVVLSDPKTEFTNAQLIERVLLHYRYWLK